MMYNVIIEEEILLLFLCFEVQSIQVDQSPALASPRASLKAMVETIMPSEDIRDEVQIKSYGYLSKSHFSQ